MEKHHSHQMCFWEIGYLGFLKSGLKPGPIKTDYVHSPIDKFN
jgi:hypothetical protein